METEKQVESNKRSIAEAFGAIPDPRVAGRSKHDLVEMLVLAVCAMVCGVDDFVGIEAWGNERVDWLRRFLKLENGIPSVSYTHLDVYKRQGCHSSTRECPSSG